MATNSPGYGITIRVEGTALQLEQGRLATVEHLLAALAGVGITAATLLVEGEEIPLLDGSAQPWVEAIAEVGLQALGERPEAAPLAAPITLQQGQSFITALPSDRLRLGAAIEFPQAAIGRQLFSLELTPTAFVEQIAPARTFPVAPSPSVNEKVRETLR